MKKHINSFSLMLLTLTIAVAKPTQAQQQFNIDSSFGIQGRRVLPQANGSSALFDVWRQPDGKVLTSGQIKNHDFDLYFFRKNADGTTDNTFGNNGSFTWDIAGDEGVNAMALQADGKIVACGWQQVNNTYKSVIARVNANGTPDTTFGTKGTITFSTIPGVVMNGGTLRNIKIQSDGKIVVAGIAYHSSGYKGIVQRYDSTGVLDNNFGNNGTVAIQFASGAHSYAEDIYIQNDDKIVVLGYTSFTNYAIRLARLNANGTFDNGFGTAGKTTPSFTGFTSSSPSWLTVLPNGKIVGLGYAYNGSQYKIITFRLSSIGQMDAAYGTNGVAQFAASTNNNYAYDAHLHANHDLSIATEYYNSSVQGVAAILKVDSSGNIVNSFGTNGFFSYTTQNEGYASAIDNDNDSLFLAGGMSDNNKLYDEGYVMKAENNGNMNSSFGLNAASAGLSNTIGKDIFRLPSGNILMVGTNENADNDIVLLKYDKNGNPVTSFGNNGVVNITNSTNDKVTSVRYLSNHQLAIVSETGSQTLNFTSLGNFTGSKHYTVTVVDTNGIVVNGPFDGTFDATEFPRSPETIVDNGGNYYVLCRSSEPVVYSYYIGRHNSSFGLDNSFGTSGKMHLYTSSTSTVIKTYYNNLVLSEDNKAVMLKSVRVINDLPSIVKIDNNGSFDNSFGQSGEYYLADTIGGNVTSQLLMKGKAYYYLGYTKGGMAKVAAVNFNGTTNPVFGGNAIAPGSQMYLHELPDTSLLVAVRQDSLITIKHILSNGSIDNSFNNNTGSISVVMFNQKQKLTGWAVMPDTSIYLFHQFVAHNGIDPTYVGVSKIASKAVQGPPTTSVIEANQNLQFTVAPNPFKGELQIDFENLTTDVRRCSFQLFDITGKAIPTQHKVLSDNKVVIEGLEQLPSGNYILNMNNFNGSYFSVKLLKQ